MRSSCEKGDSVTELRFVIVSYNDRSVLEPTIGEALARLFPGFEGDVGDRTVGDPHLGAVNDPVITVALRVRLHVAGVGAAVRLGQPEAADGFAARHRRQPAVLLLVRTVGVNRKHDEAALHRDEAAQPAVAALEFLADQAVGHAVEAGAVVAIDGAAEQPELGADAQQPALRAQLTIDVIVGGAAHGSEKNGVGGPGALFWMWMTGLVGMATKYAEAVLAVKYRETDANGNRKVIAEQKQQPETANQCQR